MHFIPPLVLPAHEPNTMHIVSASHVMWGHSPASVLKRPVVYMNELTWNSANLNESAIECPLRFLRMYVMNKVEIDITPR